jgi:hypothetical protein
MHFERAGEATPAVRYYAEAAEAALANFNPEECMGIIERASPLLGRRRTVERRHCNHDRNALRPRATRVLGAGSELSARDVTIDSCSIQCDACFTVSGGCFACARNMRALAVADRASA